MVVWGAVGRSQGGYSTASRSQHVHTLGLRLVDLCTHTLPSLPARSSMRGWNERRDLKLPITETHADVGNAEPLVDCLGYVLSSRAAIRHTRQHSPVPSTPTPRALQRSWCFASQALASPLLGDPSPLVPVPGPQACRFHFVLHFVLHFVSGTRGKCVKRDLL